MRRTLCTVLAFALLNGPAAMAQPGYPDRSEQRDYRAEQGGPRYSRGDRLPSQYRQNLHVVNDWRQRGLRCADFTQVTTIQGRTQTTRGRACRQPDGSWAVVG